MNLHAPLRLGPRRLAGWLRNGTHRVVARGLLVGLAALALGGCHTWHPTSVAPQTLIPTERPRAVRLALVSGARLTLVAPVMVADSIFGSDANGVVTTAVEDVRSYEVQRLSITRTTSFVLAQISAAVTVLALIVQVQPHYRGLF